MNANTDRDGKGEIRAGLGVYYFEENKKKKMWWAKLAGIVGFALLLMACSGNSNNDGISGTGQNHS